jgi:UDP-N-acetylglucosamine 2-epimerase (non-hydrolysing)
MRDTTERPEGIKAGTLKLVGTDEGKIYEAFRMYWRAGRVRTMSGASNPYGDGLASRRIADILLHGTMETPFFKGVLGCRA